MEPLFENRDNDGCGIPVNFDDWVSLPRRATARRSPSLNFLTSFAIDSRSSKRIHTASSFSVC